MRIRSELLSAKIGGLGHMVRQQDNGLVFLASQSRFGDHFMGDCPHRKMVGVSRQMAVAIRGIEELFAKGEYGRRGAGAEQRGMKYPMRRLPRRVDIQRVVGDPAKLVMGEKDAFLPLVAPVPYRFSKCKLVESDPTFEARFEKHYLGGATTAVLRQSQADKLAALDSLIAELRKLAD